MVALIFARSWFLYALMIAALVVLFNKDQVADDVLNASRPSGDYIHAYSFGLRPPDELELQRATAYYKTLLLGEPWTPMVYANLGFCYFYQQDVPRAIAMYKKAIQMVPSVYAFYFDLGFIYMFEGDHAKAAELFRQSRALLPADRAELLRSLNISPKYERQPVLQEGSPFMGRYEYDTQMLYVHLSSLYVQLQEYQKALDVAVEGFTLYANDAQLYYNAGVASLQLGFTKEAAVLLSKALAIAPNYRDAYQYRAQIMHSLGRDELADEDMAKYKEYERDPWRRDRKMLDLHHWHDAILFFQVYR